MKKRILSGGLSALLSFAIAFAGIACVVTTYEMQTESLWYIAAGMAVLCLLNAVSALSKKSHILFGIACGIAVAILLYTGALQDSTERFLYQLSVWLDKGYGWGTVYWSEWPPEDLQPTLFLALWGSVTELAVFAAQKSKKGGIAGLIAAAIPFALCCLLSDKMPHPYAAVSLLAGCLLLLMTMGKPNRHRLLALILIPVVLFSGFSLYLAENREMPDVLQSLFDWEDTPSQFVGFTAAISKEKIDLTNVGQNDLGAGIVMTVSTEKYTGKLYLRGQSYDTYTGTEWTIAMDTSGENGWPILSDGSDTLTITPKALTNMVYIPYYLTGEWYADLVDGAYQMKTSSGSYRFTWSTISGNPSKKQLLAHQRTQYLSLPEHTERWAVSLLQDCGFGGRVDVKKLIKYLTAYFRENWTYDLQTDAMPEIETDFARWFLKKSDTGYCTHFATAATVLLRAAGIPARYVTGYTVSVKAGETTEVLEKDAHAWVEYYSSAYGWTVFDPTPAETVSTPVVPTEEPTETPTEISTEIPTETSAEMPTDGFATEPPPSREPTQPEETETVAPTHSEPTVPGNAVGSPDFRLLQIPLRMVVILGLLIGQYALRKACRRRYLSKCNGKKAILRRWKRVCHLAKLQRISPPKPLLTLAEKAVFSQHPPTSEDVAAFDLWITETEKTILNKPFPLRMILHLVLAI